MYFKNKAHRDVFIRAVQQADRRDKATLCKLYLLTADRALWRAAKRQMRSGKILLNRIRLYYGTESSYTLLCCAKDLTLGTEHITAADLADRDVIPPPLYRLIETAVGIRRNGLKEEL